jgi:hypothetical protein
MTNPKRLLTPQEVADILKIRKNTLATWRCSGRYDLPYIKVGRVVRYELESLTKFMSQQAMAHTGKAAW